MNTVKILCAKWVLWLVMVVASGSWTLEDLPKGLGTPDHEGALSNRFRDRVHLLGKWRRRPTQVPSWGSSSKVLGDLPGRRIQRVPPRSAIWPSNVSAQVAWTGRRIKIGKMVV